MKNLYELKGYEISDKLSKKEISAKEVTESFIQRIKTKDKVLNGYITENFENALKKATEIDEKRIKGEDVSIFAGVPIGIKDNICTKDLKTTCGSKMLEDYKSIYDAYVVEQIKSVDMIILGKTNMDEFAMGSSGETSFFGASKNPYNIEKVSGGSSSGSAVVVSSGESPLSLGTDTGGSIRLPSAYCGIVGLKPTYGAVSRYGLVPFSSSFDVIGPMARCVQDTAIMANIIYGKDSRDMSNRNVEFNDFTKNSKFDAKGLKIAVPLEYFNKNISSDIREKIKNVASIFEKNGAIVEEISIPELSYSLPVYYLISSAEASSNLARYDGLRYGYKTENYDDFDELFFKSRQEAFGKEVKRRIILGTYILSSKQYDKYYNIALNSRNKIRNSITNTFEKYDLILSPTTADTAFNLGEKKGQKEIYNEDLCTVFANIAGIPAITVPCGLDRNNMPIGVQLASKEFCEDTLFRGAYFVEREIEFNTKIR